MASLFGLDCWKWGAVFWDWRHDIRSLQWDIADGRRVKVVPAVDLVSVEPFRGLTREKNTGGVFLMLVTRTHAFPRLILQPLRAVKVRRLRRERSKVESESVVTFAEKLVQHMIGLASFDTM